MSSAEGPGQDPYAKAAAAFEARGMSKKDARQAAKADLYRRFYAATPSDLEGAGK